MTPAVPKPERPDAVDLPASPALADGAGHRGFSARSRFARRGFLLGAFGALLANLSGCGQGNAFSGGGFPIGKSVVVGRVVSAEDPQIVFAGVRITLLATPPNSTSQRFEATTDANGSFTIPDVPTGDLSGAAQMVVAPTDPAVRQQSLFFSVINGKKRGLFITLPKTSFDVSQAKSLVIIPPTIAVRPGETIRINAQLLDEQKDVIPLLPTLIYDADLGTVGGDGTFSGTTQGTGSVVASWYNNLSAVATISVDPNAPSLPPPPPRAPQPILP